MPQLCESASYRIPFRAILTDYDWVDDNDLSNNPAKLPSLASDGHFTEIFYKLVSKPIRVSAQRIPADIPFVLPQHLLYTQSTSSAL